MAGDWIPMRLDLAEDPAVIAIATATGLDEYAVVGRLHRLWGWANRQLASGTAPGITSNWVDRYVSAPGFAAAMLAAGWLCTRSGDAIEFPHFERWNSGGAKKRLLNNKWMQQTRAGGPKSGAKRVPKRGAVGGSESGAECGAANTTNAPPEKRREEKRREKKKTEEDTPLPPAEPGGGVRAYPAVAATGEEDDPGPERPRGSAPPAPAPGPAPGPGFDPTAEPSEVEPWGELVAAWVGAMLPGHDAPHGIQRTPNRVAFWQTRLRAAGWRTRWREAVARAGRSLRCRGAAGGWSLRLDTFLKEEDLLVRILEGEFDDAPATLPFPGPGGPPAGPVKDVRERMREIEQAAKRQRDGTSGAA